MKIKIGTEEFDMDYEAQLEISEETINEDLKTQASLFAFYAVLSEHASVDLNVYEAQLDTGIRANAEKKLTEKQVLARLWSDALYIEKTRNVGVLKAVVKAFGQRKETVIALASNMRAQLDPEIYLKKEELKVGG